MNELITDMHQKNELDRYFEKLQGAVLPEEVDQIQSAIWEIWLNPADPELAALMNLGCDEMELGDFQQSIRTFTEMVEIAPDCAEAWNKRATVYYHIGLYKMSLQDVEQTLKYEPRHFGAISGKANMLREMGEFCLAYRALKQLKCLVPYQEGLEEQIEEIRCKIKKD